MLSLFCKSREIVTQRQEMWCKVVVKTWYEYFFWYFLKNNSVYACAFQVFALPLQRKIREVSYSKWKFGWVAETSSLLNCRTGNRTGGSNPPASAYFCIWRFRLVARTHASHAWNTGSIPVGATSVGIHLDSNLFFVSICIVFFLGST